ncbi:MAG TPA: lysophospholipid acyltransferase family protein [Pirellulales bacterium]|nr:lysophospholipid acyltransferase family protein [Pirellulales bacterium]
MQGLLQYMVYVAVRVFICVVQALQMETCQKVAAGLATLFSSVLCVREKTLDDNLRHAFPQMSDAERRQLTWRMWEHLFLLVVEIAHAPRKIHETNWREYLQFVGDASPRLTGLLLSDRPVIIVSAHFGNFEMAGYLLGILGFPTYTVARTLDNPRIDAFLNRFRSRTGQHMIPKKGGYEQIVETLARGLPMTFLADQYAGSKGCWVDFFGRPASAHKAIALFALNHDAPLVVGYGERAGRPLHYRMGLEASADPRSGDDCVKSVPRLTQWYTSHLESVIRRAPEQYWWLHRRWKDNRPAKRRGKLAA